MLPNEKPESGEREVYNETENENGDGFTSNTKQTISAEEVRLALGSVAQPSDQIPQQEQQHDVNNTSVNYDTMNNSIPLTNAGSANGTSGIVAAGQTQAPPQVPGNGANGNNVPSGCRSSVDDDEVDYAAIFRMATSPGFSNPQRYDPDNDPENLWENFIGGDRNAGIINDDILGLERPIDEFFL